MKSCSRFEPMLRAYASGDAEIDNLDTVLEHCKTCASCREVLALHQELTDLGRAVAEPDPSEFEQVRLNVLRRVARPRKEVRPWVFPPLFWLRPAALAALALLVFAGGLVAGRLSFDSSTGAVRPLLSEISAEAVANRRLTDVEDSLFTYSNVSFRRLDDDSVSLAFDVSKHMEVVEPVGSELVKEVLVHSLLNPSHTGSRLKAISFAAGVMDPKVKQALIFAMQRDENLAVRLRALSILNDYPVDREVESAVLATLREDESVQMRLEALDYLAGRSLDHELLRRTVEETQTSEDAALLVRLAEYEP